MEKGSLSNSLYAKYIAERAGGKLIEKEHGYIAYNVKGSEYFIMDMFIEPSMRRTPLFKRLMDELTLIAKSSGGTHLTANIFLDDPGASNTLIAALKLGFRVRGANVGALFIAKELEGS